MSLEQILPTRASCTTARLCNSLTVKEEALQSRQECMRCLQRCCDPDLWPSAGHGSIVAPSGVRVRGWKCGWSWGSATPLLQAGTFSAKVLQSQCLSFPQAKQRKATDIWHPLMLAIGVSVGCRESGAMGHITIVVVPENVARCWHPGDRLEPVYDHPTAGFQDLDAIDD